MPDGPDLEAPDVEDISHPFNRRVGLAVALIVLFGGLIGFGATVAGIRDSQTSREAERASVTALATQDTSTTTFESDLSQWVDVTTVAQRRDMLADQAALFGAAAADGSAASWATAASELSGMGPLSAAGPLGDAPDQLSAQLFLAPDEAQLRQQAAQRTAGGWGGKSNGYVAVGSLLTVPLALLGLSLTLSGAGRRVLVSAAVAVVLACLVGGVLVLARPVHSTPDAAIVDVAAGDQSVLTHDFAGAIRQFDRAIALDPGYPEAYQRRALAEVLADSPERNISQYIVSSSSTRAWQAGVADLRKALALGGDDYGTLTNLSGYEEHTGDFRSTVDDARRAIALNPGPPLPYVNLGLGYLGLGESSAAEADYAQLLKIIAGRPDPRERTELFASVRSTLASLAGTVPAQAAVIDRIEADYVRAEADAVIPNAVAPDPSATASLSASVQAAAISIKIDYQRVTPGSRLAWVVYYQAVDSHDWVEQIDLGNARYETSKIAVSGTAYKVVTDPLCRTNGTYRVDLYNDGRRLASVSVGREATTAALTSDYDPVAGIAVCRPAQWSTGPTQIGTIALSAPDGGHTLAVREARVPASMANQLDRDVVTSVLDHLAGQLPGPAVRGREFAATLDGLAGTARVYALPGGRAGYLWAALPADHFVRTVQATYPVTDAGDLPDLILRIAFYPLTD